MSLQVLTLKLNPSQQDELLKTFRESAVESSAIPPYSRYQLRVENCTITCYNSGKVVFQGKDAEVYAAKYQTSSLPSSTNKKTGSHQFPQAGSDEVGTGDYFGPVCVCATIIQESDLPLLSKLGVRDSKALTDSDIRKIAPQLMKAIVYSLLVVDNTKYNSVHDRYNMNAIKAVLHNQAYINLAKKATLPDFKIIDQFAEEPIYYHYLKAEPQVMRGIHFETKAENKYPAVGAASIIARYAFLKAMDQMEEFYGMEFHKGAGTAVDDNASEFVKKFGREKLGEVAKLHFKNTERIKG